MARTLELVEQDIDRLAAMEEEFTKIIDVQRKALMKERARIQRSTPRKDMLHQPCGCGKGKLEEFDMWGDRVRCSACGTESWRWHKI